MVVAVLLQDPAQLAADGVLPADGPVVQPLQHRAGRGGESETKFSELSQPHYNLPGKISTVLSANLLDTCEILLKILQQSSLFMTLI